MRTPVTIELKRTTAHPDPWSPWPTLSRIADDAGHDDASS
jgi:hypothetical protein